MEKVQVLMSTYNGEKYLKQQLDSIFSQRGVDIHLLVRDDGSKDKTLDILNDYKNKHSNMDVIKGKNVGACHSFFELINKSGSYKFYSFADQDDVWDIDKLEIAVNSLKNKDIPAVYSSNTRLVDAELNIIKNENDNPKCTLGSAMIKNYCTGCTMVFNNHLMSNLKNKTPNYAPMHDWWINLVCLAIGGISIYDIKPHINYRQHGNNVLGAESNVLKKAKKRFYKFINKPYHRDIMSKELYNMYVDDLNNQSKEILNTIKTKKNRIFKIIKNKEIRTNDFLTNLLFMILTIFYKI